MKGLKLGPALVCGKLKAEAAGESALRHAGSDGIAGSLI